jgi:hypothetical protein
MVPVVRIVPLAIPIVQRANVGHHPNHEAISI